MYRAIGLCLYLQQLMDTSTLNVTYLLMASKLPLYAVNNCTTLTIIFYYACWKMYFEGIGQALASTNVIVQSARVYHFSIATKMFYCVVSLVLTMDRMYVVG